MVEYSPEELEFIVWPVIINGFGNCYVYVKYLCVSVLFGPADVDYPLKLIFTHNFLGIKIDVHENEL